MNNDITKYDLGAINDGYINDGSSGIDEKDVKNLVDNGEDWLKKLRGIPALSRIIEDIELLFAIVADYYKGNYREIPLNSILAIVFSLLYVINPFDIIPDVIPIIGYLDDAAVVSLCFNMIDGDLQKYKAWKRGKNR